MEAADNTRTGENFSSQIIRYRKRLIWSRGRKADVAFLNITIRLPPGAAGLPCIRHETVAWIKRLRDMRRLAETKAPGVFLPPPPLDFVGRVEILEMLYAVLVENRGSALLYGGPD